MKKNFTLTLLIAAAMIGFSMSASAQSNTTGDASVVVIEPLTIVQQTPMNFGEIAAYDAAGTVEILPNSTSTPTNVRQFGTTVAATFTVTGDDLKTFSVTLPDGLAGNEIYLTDQAATPVGADMEVTAFSEDLDETTPGVKTFNVGATLNVGATQAAGTYAGTYPVIVQYN